MFENIKEEQSEYRWNKLDEMDEKKQEYEKVMAELKESLNEIVRIRAAEIVYLVYEKTEGISFPAYVFIDLDTGELVIKTEAENTISYSGRNLIQICKIDDNWISNSSCKMSDLLSDDEKEKLEGDFPDRREISKIGVDLDTRLMDILRYWIEEKY